MKHARIFILAVMVTAAACTDASNPAAPAAGAARFDGGITFGGGNVTGGDTCDGERSGGITFGGGNNAPVPCSEPTP